MLEPISYNSPKGRARIESLVARQFEVPKRIEKEIKAILERVREKGDDALVEYTRRFDAPDFTTADMRVTATEIERAYQEVDLESRRSLAKAISHIEAFHVNQVPRSWMTTREDGVILGQMVRPVDAAGLYVPGGQGGKTPLVSTVLMNAIPARIAGVRRMVLATPPNREGAVNPCLLVAAAEVGVREIYKMGSAWAIAALAYGTPSVAPVDVLVGPGNIYVTLAKKMVAGTVGIDMVAGPSEVLILADHTARPPLVAADILSQAEHDPLATAALLTTSPELALEVAQQLVHQLGQLGRAEVARQSLAKNGLLLVVDDLETAVGLANRISPEHLEVLVADPWWLLPRLRHAGAIFLGPYTPEPVGDYIAGPNHVLPTMGTARFSSALGVETFLTRSSILSYSAEAFAADAPDIVRLAEIEGLDAHARAVRVRMT